MTAEHGEPVLVYWRPGCPYCSTLLDDLDRAGIPVRRVNIWQDPAAAERVRSLAKGHETVPTVVVGGEAMVNPRASQVVDLLRLRQPNLVDAVDSQTRKPLTAGPWHAGLAVTIALAVGWYWLATSDPSTSYHLAPALITMAWPPGRRLHAGGPLPLVTAMVTAMGGAAVAALAVLTLAFRGALGGSPLIGTPGPRPKR